MTAVRRKPICFTSINGLRNEAKKTYFSSNMSANRMNYFITIGLPPSIPKSGDARSEPIRTRFAEAKPAQLLVGSEGNPTCLRATSRKDYGMQHSLYIAGLSCSHATAFLIPSGTTSSIYHLAHPAGTALVIAQHGCRSTAGTLPTCHRQQHPRACQVRYWAGSRGPQGSICNRPCSQLPR
jgi:hypothetical protein